MSGRLWGWQELKSIGVVGESNRHGGMTCYGCGGTRSCSKFYFFVECVDTRGEEAIRDYW